jgi:hypothetical protein
MDSAFDASSVSEHFTVFVVNKTDWKIIAWSVNSPDDWNGVDPPIGRTCNSSLDQCWKNGNYLPLHRFPADSEFDLYLAADCGGGVYRPLGPRHITPDGGKDVAVFVGT